MTFPSSEKRMLTVFSPVAFMIAVTAWVLWKIACYEDSAKLKIIYEGNSNAQNFLSYL